MLYSVLFFIMSIIFICFGNLALFKNYKNTNNRLYFIITSLFAFWSLINAALFLVTDPEIASSVRRFTAISWGTIYSVILHFTIRLSGLNKKFEQKYRRVGMYMFLYIPALFNLILYLSVYYSPNELLLSKSGWTLSNITYKGFIWENFFFIYYALFMVLTTITIIIWRCKTSKLREKKYAGFLLASFVFTMIFGSLFEVILPLQGIVVLSGITLFFSLVPVVVIYYIIQKYGFLSFGADKLASQAMNLTSEGVIICDTEGIIKSYNEGAIDLLGYDKTNGLTNIKQFGLKIENDVLVKSKDVTLLKKDGTKINVLLSSKEITDSVKELYGYIVIFQDLSDLRETQTKLKELNQNLEEKIEERTKELILLNKDLLKEIKNRKEAELKIHDIAYRDFLTGLYNRRYYEDALVRLDKESNYPISLVMADINGLKLINDAFGHKEGDKLLIQASSIIKKSCRKNDIVSRVGGDEFVIIMPNTTGIEAEEVIKSINLKAKEIEIHSITLSISFGYRTKTNKTDDIQEVFRYAEDLMYREKLLKIPSMRSNAIETILKTLYEKDKDSEIHSRAVSLYSEKIAEACGMERQEISEVKTAGLLHDIGKILIPERILTKKGLLVDDEFAEMRNHPEIGFRVLNSTHEMRSISNTVLHHHERWDGLGYPMRIKGEKIPLVSRIIALADSFDAMTSKRFYKDVISDEEALKEIIKNSGTQFDPKLVEVFKANFKDIVNIEKTIKEDQ